MRTRTAVACALPALLLALPAGCGGAVDLDPDPVPPADAAACEEFADALPASLLGLERRDTEPVDAPGGAWGDPAVVVTCGVDLPEGFDAFSACEEADGVGWYAPVEAYEDPGAAVTLTTVTVEPRVRLEVPGEHRPPAGFLSALAPLVRAHLRTTEPCV